MFSWPHQSGQSLCGISDFLLLLQTNSNVCSSKLWVSDFFFCCGGCFKKRSTNAFPSWERFGLPVLQNCTNTHFKRWMRACEFIVITWHNFISFPTYFLGAGGRPCPLTSKKLWIKITSMEQLQYAPLENKMQYEKTPITSSNLNTTSHSFSVNLLNYQGTIFWAIKSHQTILPGRFLSSRSLESGKWIRTS